MENGEVENVTYLQTAMTSWNVLFGDLALRCLFQWRSFTPDEILPAPSECPHMTIALYFHLGGWEWGGEVFQFLLGRRSF